MIRLENVLKISLQDVLKTSSKRLEDGLKMSWRRSSRRLEDVLKSFLQDVLKTSWKRFEDVLARRLEDVLKTTWKRLEDVLKTYGQEEYIGLDQDVLKTSSEGTRLRWTYSSWWRRPEDEENVFIEENVAGYYSLCFLFSLFRLSLLGVLFNSNNYQISAPAF